MSKLTLTMIDIYTMEPQEDGTASVALVNILTSAGVSEPADIEELGTVPIDTSGVPDCDAAAELAQQHGWPVTGTWGATSTGYWAEAARKLSDHSIVVPGITEGTLVGDGTRVTEAGEMALNRLIKEACEARWPLDNFAVIPGGRAKDEWSRLVNGNGWATPDSVGITDEVDGICFDAICDEWEPSRFEPIND